MSIKPEQLTLNAAHIIINWPNEQNTHVVILEDTVRFLTEQKDNALCALDNEKRERQHFEKENKSLRQSLQDCEITRATILKVRDELQKKIATLEDQNRMLVNEKNRRREVHTASSRLQIERDEARREAVRYRDMMRERAPNQIPTGLFSWETAPVPALCTNIGKLYCDDIMCLMHNPAPKCTDPDPIMCSDGACPVHK